MELKFSRCSLRVNFSFFAVLALMLLFRDRQTALVCFLSAMLHECGHLLLLGLFGARVRAVAFSGAGVVIERDDVLSLPGSREALAALGGVAVNGMLCLLALLLRQMLPEKTFAALFCANALLGALNLLPVYPLDLWRALFAAFEGRVSREKLARVLMSVSRSATLLFCAFCGFYFWKIGRNPSLLAVCLYLLLLNVKRSTTDV